MLALSSNEASSSHAIPPIPNAANTDYWTATDSSADDCMICYDKPPESILGRMNCCKDVFVHLGCLKKYFAENNGDCPFCRKEIIKISGTKKATYSAEEQEERGMSRLWEGQAATIIDQMNRTTVTQMIERHQYDRFKTSFNAHTRNYGFTQEVKITLIQTILRQLAPTMADNEQEKFVALFRNPQNHQVPPVAAQQRVNLETAIDELFQKVTNDQNINACLNEFDAQTRHLNLSSEAKKAHLGQEFETRFDFLTEQQRNTFLDALTNFHFTNIAQQQAQLPIRNEPTAGVRGPINEPRPAVPARARENNCNQITTLVSALTISVIAVSVLLGDVKF